MREDAAIGETIQTKIKKAESLERLSSSLKLWRVPKENNLQRLEAQVCLRLSKSLPFLFYTHFIFHASVADW